MKRWILLLLIPALVHFHRAVAQDSPFEIQLQAAEVPGLPGVQSYAFGQAGGKWLIVGGRVDGLHRFQPFLSFDAAGRNTDLIVIDPVYRQVWTKPMSVLPASIKEQLSSTNMEFWQEGNYLYCVGGYGYSETQSNRVTYDKLTAIDVPNVINAVINDQPYASYFRQITDAQFQVTGGRLRKINDTYYLLGGQKFTGAYTMGGGGGPGGGTSQQYTNAVRKFTLTDDGTTITVTHLTPYLSSTYLHRRDYNAESQILPNGEEGVTMFSGVFQQSVDLPFLNAVTVDANGYSVESNFEQHYNHYHCPALPVYSASSNEMHTVFFGGIAQFYENNGTLVQDDNVPFVKTIARVTRDGNGNMTETKLPVEMPGLLGASAEFIPNLSLPHYPNHVFKLDSLAPGDHLMGYIYGGIHSTQPNIFFSNNGTQSWASTNIYKVILTVNAPLPVELKKLTARAGSRENIIRWRVASEDLSHYEILCSSDGRDFMPIGTVAAKGGSDEIQYEYAHARPAKLQYYRLAMYDRDGHHRLSEVVTVYRADDDRMLMNVYPNPAHSELTVETDGAPIRRLALLNLSGQLIRSYEPALVSPSATLRLMGLKPGMYLLRVESDRAAGLRRLVIE